MERSPSDAGDRSNAGSRIGKEVAGKAATTVRRLSRTSLIALVVTGALSLVWVYTFDEEIRHEALYLFSLIGVGTGMAVDAIWTRMRKKNERR